MKNKLLGELVDVNLKTTLKVGRLILVDNANLGEFVNHGIYLGSILLGCCLVCCVAEVWVGESNSYCGNENPEY